MKSRDENTSPAGPAASGLPSTLGGCRLLELLGSGATGTVYRALTTAEQDLLPSDQEVAIKVLNPLVQANPVAFARFTREGRLGGRIDHPAVVRIHLADSTPLRDGRVYFLVMEHVTGKTLAALLAEHQRLPEALLRDIALQIAEGLVAIHAVGAVHRDLKPTNVICTPDHRVKILDLGLAHLLDAVVPLTHTGAFTGTPAYAAPELVDGGPVAPAVDLYALGVILYECATGGNPFAAPTLLETLRRQTRLDPPALADASGAISPFLDELVRLLLIKPVATRLATAAILVEALRNGEESSWWRERRSSLLEGRGLRRPRGRLRPLVGRDAELERLRRYLGGAHSGAGLVVVVAGEPGVGTSRLVEELANSADDCTVLRSVPDGGSGAGSLADAVVEVLGDSTLEVRLKGLFQENPDVAGQFANFLRGHIPPASTLTAESRRALFVLLLRKMASERPVVWTIDDLHLLRSDELALLAHVARAVHHDRVLVIATADEGWLAVPRAVELLASCQRLSLARLPESNIVEILQAHPTNRKLTRRQLLHIAQRSDGNPFFALELASGGHDPTQSDDRASTLSTQGGTLPPSLRDAVVARLGGLDDVLATVLDVAAVIGQVFDPDLIARVLGQPRLAVLQQLAALERQHRLVRSVGAMLEFDHRILHEVVVVRVPPLLRREYHALVATAYAEREGVTEPAAQPVPPEASLFLVRHWLNAGRFDRCQTLLVPTLNRLGDAGAHAERLSLADQALALLSADRNDPTAFGLAIALQLEAVDALRVLGHAEAIEPRLDTALTMATHGGDDRAIVRIQLQRVSHRIDIGAFMNARALASEVQALAARLDDGPSLAEATHLLGFAIRKLGDYDAALEQLRRSCDLAARFGNPTLRLRTTLALGHTLKSVRRIDEAIAVWNLALEQVGPDVDRREHGWTIGAISAVETERGRYEAGCRGFRQQAAIARRFADGRQEHVALTCLAYAAMCAGDLVEARASLEESVTLARERMNRPEEVTAFSLIGVIDLFEGQPTIAEERLHEALAAARRHDFERLASNIMRHLGELAELRRHFPEAVKWYRSSWAIERRVGDLLTSTAAQICVARAAILEGDHDGARRWLRAASFIADSFQVVHILPLPSCYLAWLGVIDPTTVAVPEISPVDVRIECHLILARAGGGEAHLQRGLELANHLSRHLEGTARQAFNEYSTLLRYVPVVRTV